MACTHRLLSMNYGLLQGKVAHDFGLLGFPGSLLFVEKLRCLYARSARDRIAEQFCTEVSVPRAYHQTRTGCLGGACIRREKDKTSIWAGMNFYILIRPPNPGSLRLKRPTARGNFGWTHLGWTPSLLHALAPSTIFRTQSLRKSSIEEYILNHNLNPLRI